MSFLFLGNLEILPKIPVKWKWDFEWENLKVNQPFYRPFKKKCWLPGCLRAVSGFVTAEMETLCMLFTFIPNFGQIESVYGSNMGVLSPLFTFHGHFAGYLWTILLEEYPKMIIFIHFVTWKYHLDLPRLVFYFFRYCFF